MAETDGISVGQQLTVGEGKSTSADTGTVSPKPTQPITTPSAAAKPPVQPTTDGAAQQHTVQAGETLFSIAKRYGATVADLRRWNNLTETDGVKIGQVLVVTQPTAKPASADSTRPSPASPVGTVIEYTAQPGDTLYKIARAHGVTVAQLLEWNGKSSPAVSVGEKVKIRK
ncbi:MAG: LysM peptidoglycan-binding domain-containing protein [Cytophagales bacterium]|nr:LysM peptidoglycan-binding domain-containing protein [Cytophagales bacterium]